MKGVRPAQLSFIQHSALLSSFPTEQKLPRCSPESGIELYRRLCHVTMETFPWRSPLQKQTLSGRDFNRGVKILRWSFCSNSKRGGWRYLLGDIGDTLSVVFQGFLLSEEDSTPPFLHTACNIIKSTTVITLNCGLISSSIN